MRTGDRGGGGGCVEEDAQAVQVVHRQAHSLQPGSAELQFGGVL